MTNKWKLQKLAELINSFYEGIRHKVFIVFIQQQYHTEFSKYTIEHKIFLGGEKQKNYAKKKQKQEKGAKKLV